MSSEYRSSDFYRGIVMFYELCQFIDGGSRGRDVVYDKQRFFSCEGKILDQRKGIFEIMQPSVPIQARLCLGMSLFFRYGDHGDVQMFT